ncbi:hypothetical protein F4V43_05320 [Paenibacillus spiritus]|uniref:Uncharacterized protein n=1 Tax=Paenibacillus spiritus TaxID=2496557 RepID=A0A5J5GFV0_9BACL|nr:MULTISPECIES: hypothetical protein [Paenibacillus]KAA9006374.1 hypothetical protein F4V43_05320 [Paenibacillus spiritus]
MDQDPSKIEVRFTCKTCKQDITITFMDSPVSSVSCSDCGQVYTVMRPAVADEILFDWENEAMFQKFRADQSENSNESLMSLIIKVIEQLTWRDQGNGQVEAIKMMRNWLIENESVPMLSELIKTRSDNRPYPKRDFRS